MHSEIKSTVIKDVSAITTLSYVVTPITFFLSLFAFITNSTLLQHNGFRVAASNLPKAAVPVNIPDSEDVAAAKAVFVSEIAKAKAAHYHH